MLKGVHKAGRLIAVDPSLTCSGWALFGISDETLIAVGKFKSLPPSTPLAERLRNLQQRFRDCLSDLELSGQDFLVCEAPTTMRDPRAAILVEQVRSLFETLARERGIVVPGRVNPRTVHREVMGLVGKQLPRVEIKQIAVRVVEALYRRDLNEIGFVSSGAEMKRHQDIVDAILVGNVALARLRSARATGIEPENVFEAMVQRRRGSYVVRSSVK